MVWNDIVGQEFSTWKQTTEGIYNRSLNDASRNWIRNNLEMFLQATDSCVTWNSLEKLMWVKNIYMGSGGGQKSILKRNLLKITSSTNHKRFGKPLA